MYFKFIEKIQQVLEKNDFLTSFIGLMTDFILQFSDVFNLLKVALTYDLEIQIAYCHHYFKKKY